MRHSIRGILTALGLLTGLLFVVQPAVGATTVTCSHGWYGYIGDKYNGLGGPAGIMGCPTTDEMDVAEGSGRIQYFQNGVITWSPNTGPASVQALWRQNGELRFTWGPTNPLNYDRWLLNVRRNGQDVGLDREFISYDTGQVGRYGGGITVPTAGAGYYRVTVEGCDYSSGSHTCRQGWTNPLYLSL